MSVAVQSSVFIPDCIQGQAGRNHRIVSRAETIAQDIVAVRTATVHTIRGIGIVGRDEVILLQWERDDGGGFINQSINQSMRQQPRTSASLDCSWRVRR